MKIAYLILAHQTGPGLDLLIETLLGDDRSRVYIHFDRKSPGFEQLQSQWGRQCVLLEHRVTVNWGGYSVVRATIELLRTAFSDATNERFVLLSGACFPLRPMKTINHAIADRELPWLALWGRMDPRLKTNEGLGRYVVTKYHPLDVPGISPKRNALLARLWGLFERINVAAPYQRKVDATRLWKGSQFFVLDRASAKQGLDRNAELSQLLQYAKAPDEIYFSTVYHDYCVKNGITFHLTDPEDPVQALHYIRKRAPGQRTLGQRLLENPDIRHLTEADVSEMLASSALFARKVDSNLAQMILQSTRS